MPLGTSGHAAADEGFDLIGGTLSNMGSLNSAGQSNKCNSGTIQIFHTTRCKTVTEGNQDKQDTVSGGLLSNFASSSTTEASNHCGTPYFLGAFNTTECETVSTSPR